MENESTLTKQESLQQVKILQPTLDTAVFLLPIPRHTMALTNFLLSSSAFEYSQRFNSMYDLCMFPYCFLRSHMYLDSKFLEFLKSHAFHPVAWPQVAGNPLLIDPTLCPGLLIRERPKVSAIAPEWPSWHLLQPQCHNLIPCCTGFIIFQNICMSRILSTFSQNKFTVHCTMLNCLTWLSGRVVQLPQ